MSHLYIKDICQDGIFYFYICINCQCCKAIQLDNLTNRFYKISKQEIYWESGLINLSCDEVIVKNILK